jgi:hypothetical protein
MDEKYFDDMLRSLYIAGDLKEPLAERRNILKRIAADARRECERAVVAERDELDKNVGLSNNDRYCFGSSISAIRALGEREVGK